MFPLETYLYIRLLLVPADYTLEILHIYQYEQGTGVEDKQPTLYFDMHISLSLELE